MSVWEPHTFEVGDRVRIRVSPECQKTNHLDPLNPEEEMDLDTGVVVSVGDARFRRIFPDGHWYGVVTDEWMLLIARIFGVGVFLEPVADRAPQDWYAAIELEPDAHRQAAASGGAGE